jgi:hypothetical protein
MFTYYTAPVSHNRTCVYTRSVTQTSGNPPRNTWVVNQLPTFTSKVRPATTELQGPWYAQFPQKVHDIAIGIEGCYTVAWGIIEPTCSCQVGTVQSHPSTIQPRTQHHCPNHTQTGSVCQTQLNTCRAMRVHCRARPHTTRPQHTSPSNRS